MRAAAAVIAGAVFATGVASWAAQSSDNPLQRMTGGPVGAADIAAAVADCVTYDGDAQALMRLGYAKLGDAAPRGQLIAYRRGAAGPVVMLPGTRNELRCWVISTPADAKAKVVDAINAKLGVANMGGSEMPGWRLRDYSLTFDWFDETGKPRINRVEVYKFPQESK